MKVIVTGSTGLIGTALVDDLTAAGHQVTRLVRDGEGPRWNPMAGTIDAGALEGHDAVVHLAGVGIGDHRWTDEHKRAVLERRTRGTALLAETLAKLDRPPAGRASAPAPGLYRAPGGGGVGRAKAPGHG